MMLWLKPEQVQTILDHTRRDAPNEACGLLFGRRGEVTRVVPTSNADTNPESGFAVAPVELVSALTSAQHEGLELVGIYHSHPKGHPIPSERDIREAHYPRAAQIIVGLSGSAPEIATWRIERGRVSRIDLFIQSERPLSSATEPDKLSVSQRVAVIAAGLIAVIIVIITALALLPPPPEIIN